MTPSQVFMSLLLVVIPFQLFAQADDYTVDETNQKPEDEIMVEALVAKYARMKQNGYIVLGVGLGSLGGGIALMSVGEWTETRTPTSVNYNAKDGKAGVGLVLTIAALPLTIVGAILASRGAKRHRYWQERLYVHTSQVGQSPTFGLGYKF